MSINSIVKEYGILFPKLIPYIKSLKIYPEKKALTKNEIQFLIFNYLKFEECWDKSGHRTSFNQIQKLRFNNIVNDISRNLSSNKSYLELKNNTKFFIRKQDEFHYLLVCSIYDYLKKNNDGTTLLGFYQTDKQKALEWVTWRSQNLSPLQIHCVLVEEAEPGDPGYVAP